jgi:hypothetical protein
MCSAFDIVFEKLKLTHLSAKMQRDYLEANSIVCMMEMSVTSLGNWEKFVENNNFLENIDNTSAPKGTEAVLAAEHAALAGLDEGHFTEGHELDHNMRVPKAMIGRRLSQEEAKRLLAKFE